MTFSPAVAVLIAGVLALVYALLSASGMRAAQLKGVPPPPGLSRETLRLFQMRTLFVPVFFGFVSVAFPSALVATSLGMTVCSGMAIYFALQGWAFAKSPEMIKAGPYLGTYLAFGASACYVFGLITANVI